jgi:hypothetical protein
MTIIRCGSCYRPLSQQEIDGYPFDEFLLRDALYCMECRTCPDDCGQEPCNAASYLDPMYV